MQPLAYAALAFGFGIIIAGAEATGWSRLPVGWLGWLWVVAAPAAVVLLLWRPPAEPATNQSSILRRMTVALGLLACLGAGYARAHAVIVHPVSASPLTSAAAALAPHPHDKVWLIGYARDTPEVLYDPGMGPTLTPTAARAYPGAVRIDLEAVGVGTPGAEAGTGPRLVHPARGGVRLYAYPPLDKNGAPSRSAAWIEPLLTLRAGEGVAVRVHLRALAHYLDPGVADFTAAARRQGIEYSATLPLEGWRRWPALAGPRGMVLRARIWRWLSGRIDGLAPPAAEPRLNGLLRGMLLGDVSRLQQATRDTFQIDGVYHLLVVAGLHIGVLFVFLLVVFRLIRVPRLTAGLLSLLLLAGYDWIIAGRAPTERAWLMLAIYAMARFWYRDRQALNAVGFAALVLMAVHPLALFGPGLQLTLGAAVLLAGVAAPVLASTLDPLRRACRQPENVSLDAAFPPRLMQFRLDLRAFAQRLSWFWAPLGWRCLPWALRGLLWLAEVIVISLILQFGFAGFNAVYFHRASPYAALANAVLVPAAGLLIPLAWLGVGLGAIWTPGAEWLARLIAAVGHGMLGFADALAAWPGANVRVPSPPGWMVVLFAGAAVCWIIGCVRAARGTPVSRPRWRMPALTSLGMAALALVLAWAPFPPRLPAGLSATILDVGQGDSIFVGFPDGRTLLVDGGPRSAHWDTGEAVVAPFLWSLGLHRLDAVLLTHAHNDHLGGLSTVVADFRPSVVWVTGSLPQDAAVEAFLRLTQASGARLRRTVAGDSYLAGAARLQVLLPPPAYRAGPAPSNDDSMAVRVSWGPDSMLLEGDAEAVGERWMLDHNLSLASILLKVGHHGSKTSSTAAFLAAVHPRVAIISDGEDNIYGFPDPVVLGRLQAAGARVFRTDEDGAVQCRFEQGWLRIYRFRPWPRER